MSSTKPKIHLRYALSLEDDRATTTVNMYTDNFVKFERVVFFETQTEIQCKYTRQSLDRTTSNHIVRQIGRVPWVAGSVDNIRTYESSGQTVMKFGLLMASCLNAVQCSCQEHNDLLFVCSASSNEFTIVTFVYMRCVPKMKTPHSWQ